VTRDEAARSVRALFAEIGQTSEGLNAEGLGGIGLGETDVYFEHRADGALKCSARIYRFRAAPKRKVLEAFRQVERARGCDTGGGRFEFQPDNGGIYLSRLYAEAVDSGAFVEDVKRLALAAAEWRTKVTPRVVSYTAGF
jgi:hypothetical protein